MLIVFPMLFFQNTDISLKTSPVCHQAYMDLLLSEDLICILTNPQILSWHFDLEYQNSTFCILSISEKNNTDFELIFQIYI